MVTSTERLAQQIEALRRRMDSSFRTPQLTRSSIDDGTLVIVSGGNTTGAVGVQVDGTSGAVTLGGPNPPTPTEPTMTSTPGGVLIHMDGQYDQSQSAPNGYPIVVSPLDFARYEVQVSASVAFNDPGFGPKVMHFDSPAGGDRFVSWEVGATPLYARARTRSTAGKFSAWTGIVGPVSSGQVQIGDIGFDIAQYSGGTTVYYTTGAAPTPPSWGFTPGDLWLKQVGISVGAPGEPPVGTPMYETYRWLGASWALLQDQGISDSLASAILAQQTADSKARTFRQPTAPTGLTSADAGDLWYDTDDGNKLYIWDTSGTATRTNWAINPSFEYDAAGTVTSAPAGWTRANGGTTGTIATSVVASGATYGTKVGKITGTTLSTLNTAWIGFSQVVPAAPGDLLYLSSWFAYTVTSGSQRPEYMVEWLNVAGGVISTLTETTQTTMGSAGSRNYIYSPTAAPALTVNARVTLRRRGTLTSGGSNISNADLSVDAVLIERNRVSTAPVTFFDGSSQFGTDVQWQGTPYMSISTAWQEGTAGSYSWQPRLLRNGAIQPQSIVASNVIATGTVTAALLEATMVLATTVVAGVLLGDHTSMEPDGLHFYSQILGEAVTEVGRMGTSTNDFFGLVDSTGASVATIDDVGKAAFQDLSVAHDPIFQGIALSASLAAVNQPVGSFRSTAPVIFGGSFYGPIQARVGLFEVNGSLVTGRRYDITWQCTWTSDTAADEADFGIHVRSSATNTAVAPVVTDAMQEQWVDTCWTANHWITMQGSFKYTATVTGRHRFLISVNRNQGTGNVSMVADSRFPVSADISDLGPAKPNAGQFSQGSGTFAGGSPPAAPPQPTQQTDTGWLAPAGWRTFAGSGTERFDTTGPVQGWDPSGFNGDGSGFWWWTIPTITGTVDWAQVWLQSDHTYFNSGGTARLNAIKAGATFPVNTYKLSSDFDVAGFPKGGTKVVDIPSWANLFHNSFGANKAIGISCGTIGSTNETYYIRFNGPAARLRLWYTQ